MNDAVTQLTVVCSHPEWFQPLIYCVDVPTYLALAKTSEDLLGGKNLYATICDEISEQRKEYFCEDYRRFADDMTLLFAFAGDLTPQFDWRD